LQLLLVPGLGLLLLLLPVTGPLLMGLSSLCAVQLLQLMSLSHSSIADPGVTGVCEKASSGGVIRAVRHAEAMPGEGAQNTGKLHHRCNCRTGAVPQPTHLCLKLP
jgi:hypothetical protein